MAKRKRARQGATIRDSHGGFVAERLPTPEELSIQVQRISPGFYPDRTVPSEVGISANERLQKARELAILYQKIGQPIPAALSILL